MTSTHETIDQLLARMRLLEKDHSPEGWPAVQMKDVTALCDEIERLKYCNSSYAKAMLLLSLSILCLLWNLV